MKVIVVFEFPPNRDEILQPRKLEQINSFFKSRLSSRNFRPFGVNVLSPNCLVKVPNPSEYYLNFKFFNSDGTKALYRETENNENVNLDFLYNIGKSRKIELERDACSLSHIASLPMTDVQFSLGKNNQLSIAVEIPISCMSLVENYRKLI